MEKHTFYCMSLLVLLLLGTQQPGHHVCSSQTDEDQCANLPGLAVLIGCLDFIRKDRPRTPPSSDCCLGVKTIGMSCTCKIITKEIENIINMKKLVFVAHVCGQPLAPGTQCGSYKVPPAANPRP